MPTTKKCLPPLNAAILDLDDTLYQCEEIRVHVGEKIVQYMLDHLGFTDRDSAETKCTELHKLFGTTFAGLATEGYKLDAEHFHAAVHSSINYEKDLKPDPELREFLLAIDLPRFVFTNADRIHSERCLSLMGIADCFEGIVHFENTQEEAAASGIPHEDCPVVCKPHPFCYHLALRLISKFNPSIPAPPSYPYPPASKPLPNYIFFDDSSRNIPVAHELGMFSVLIRPNASEDIQCSLAADSLLQLKEKLPELLNNPQLRLGAPVATPVVGEGYQGVGASHNTNNAPAFSAADLVSDPQPAAGTTPLALSPHSIPIINPPVVISHQVQPSEQLEDHTLAELAVDVSSHELAPHACNSHYLSADMDTPATNGAVHMRTSAAVSTRTHGANAHRENGAVHMRGVTAHALADVRKGIEGVAVGGNGTVHAVLGTEGPPVRARGAGEDAMYESSPPNYTYAPRPPEQSVLPHQHAEQDKARVEKVSSFLHAVRQSMNESDNACVDDRGNEEEGRWGSELLDLALEDVVSHSMHVVHANSVQEAIEAEADRWEDELLIREFGGLTRGPRSPQGGIDGAGDAMQGLGDGHEVWEAGRMSDGVANGDGGRVGGEEGGSDEAAQEALRLEALQRAARAGRHVWVQKRV